MSLIDQANLFIYRVAEKGLEVFLMNTDAEGKMGLPSTEVIEQDDLKGGNTTIHLESTTNQEGLNQANLAVEADYHEIPSLKALLKHDVKFVAGKLFSIIPDAHKGRFVNLKEAVKELLPHQYKALKELKEVISEKNQTKYL